MALQLGKQDPSSGLAEAWRGLRGLAAMLRTTVRYGLADWRWPSVSAARRGPHRLLLVAAAAVAMPAAAFDGDGGWTTWRSERFAFSICYPAEIFSKKRVSDSGHGVAVESLESAQLIAATVDYGPGTLAEPLRIERERLTHVSLIQRGENWFVVSGSRVDQALYTKAIKVGDRLYALRIRYPKSVAARYAPIVDRIAGCLKVPDDAY